MEDLWDYRGVPAAADRILAGDTQMIIWTGNQAMGSPRQSVDLTVDPGAVLRALHESIGAALEAPLSPEELALLPPGETLP